MSAGIDDLNSELSNTVCQRLRETPVRADQNSLALFSITNSTAKQTGIKTKCSVVAPGGNTLGRGIQMMLPQDALCQ